MGQNTKLLNVLVPALNNKFLNIDAIYESPDQITSDSGWFLIGTAGSFNLYYGHTLIGPFNFTGIEGPIGPQGPQGIQGVQGQKGDKGDQGNQGLTGPIGPKGEKGDKGDQGPQGEKGDNAFVFTIVARLNSVNELPPASSVSRTNAYLVNSGETDSADNTIYDLYIITGTAPNLIWTNIGPTNGILADKYEVNSSPNYVGTSATILGLTSDNGVAVATDTGHWYYWNGSKYIDGGVYQASQLEVNSVGVENLSDSLYKFITNGEYTPDIDWQDGYIDQSNGNMDSNYTGLPNSHLKKTSYIPILGNTITLDLCLIGVAGVCFYDENKNFISSLERTSDVVSGVFTAPEGARFIALTNDFIRAPSPVCTFQISNQDNIDEDLVSVIYQKKLPIGELIPGYVEPNGNLSNYSDNGRYKRSDFIAVLPNTKLISNMNLNTDQMSINFYGEKQNLLRTVSREEYRANDSIIETNSDEYYIIICSYNANGDFSDLYLRYYIEESENTKTIICWGDSITQGMAMNNVGNTYPGALDKLIKSSYQNYSVLNAGQGGNDIAVLLALTGSEPMRLSRDLDFPQGDSELLFGHAGDNGFVLFDNTPVYLRPKNGWENELFPKEVTIGNYKFNVEMRNVEWTDTPQGNTELTYDLYLIRSDTTTTIHIKQGAICQFDTLKHSQDYYYLVYMGANGYSTEIEYSLTPEKYVNFCKEIKKTHINTIIIIPEWNSIYDEALFKEFGMYAINPKEFLISSDAFTYLGIEVTAQDTTAISNNQIPPSLTVDGTPNNVHLNANGYKAMAYYIYKKLTEYGILN